VLSAIRTDPADAVANGVLRRGRRRATGRHRSSGRVRLGRPGVCPLGEAVRGSSANRGRTWPVLCR
jgi:hypothetical protein